LEQQRRVEMQKQQEAAAAANKRVHETKHDGKPVPGQAPMGAMPQGLQKAAVAAQQQQPKSYLSQFRNDKEDSQDGGHSQSSSDLQLSQDDRLSQEPFAGVELDGGLGGDKSIDREKLALLEASLKMIPDFEHDR